MNLLSPRGVADPQCAGFLGRLRRRISRTKSSSAMEEEVWIELVKAFCKGRF